MNLDALIIDPNPTTRGYLYQAVQAAPEFRSVKSSGGIPNTLSDLNLGAKYHVIILASSYDRVVIQDFIPKAKKTSGGAEAAYISVIKKSIDQTNTMASGIIGGADGFLLEPYSAETLRQVALVASKIRQDFEEARVKAGLTLLLKEMMPALDKYSDAKRQGVEAPTIKRELSLLSQNLKRAGQDYFAQVIDAAVDTFATAKPRVTKNYSGASERVKKMMEMKLQNVSKDGEKPS